MAGHGIGGRYVIDLRNAAGRWDALECRVRLDLVELWFGDRCQAVMDRDRFREWMDDNRGQYVVDDVMWTAEDGAPVMLAIRDCGSWVIAPDLMAALRDRV
jgi:hypothetical protein